MAMNPTEHEPGANAPAPPVDPVALAAQADLVMLTVEMLRSPQAIAKSTPPAWFKIAAGELEQLIDRAFPAAVGRNMAPAIPAEEVSLTNADPPLTLREAFAEVHAMAQALEQEAWSDEYWRLFDSSQACALNQASYIRRDKGTILGDVAGFYRAFGWQGDPDSGERPDHLLCQLEFVGMMLVMDARAESAEDRQVVTDAMAQFARLHMHDWIPSVCYQLIESTQLPYFGAAGWWLMVFWTALTEYHAWPADDDSDQLLTPDNGPENPYECGAPDLVDIKLPTSS